MLHANIGRRYLNATLSESQVDALPRTSRDHLRVYQRDLLEFLRDGIGLVLHGPKGHGKTHIACAIMRQAMRWYVRAVFLPVDQLQIEYFERDRAEDRAECLYERARLSDLLVLDDLGAEHERDFGTRLLEALLRERVRDKRTTIITTQLSTDEADGSYGSWFSALMLESGHPVRIEARDWRVEQRAEIRGRFQGDPQRG